jgi:hypothetical protein
MVWLVSPFDQVNPVAVFELISTDCPRQKVVGPTAVMLGIGGLVLMVMSVGAEVVLQLKAEETETVNVPVEVTSML